jgi:hypothetical protein
VQVRASEAVVDEELVELLESLWDKGFETQFSCQGMYTDAYIVFATYEQATRFVLETAERTKGALWQYITVHVMHPHESEGWRGAVQWPKRLTLDITEAWDDSDL